MAFAYQTLPSRIRAIVGKSKCLGDLGSLLPPASSVDLSVT